MWSSMTPHQTSSEWMGLALENPPPLIVSPSPLSNPRLLMQTQKSWSFQTSRLGLGVGA